MGRGIGGRVRAIALGLTVAAVAGCGDLGDPLEELGVRIPPPDEFQVIARKPLQIPASRTLPEPVPGAPSPLEPDPSRDAIVALLGTDQVARPGESSAAEEVLLSSANAAASDPAIRVQLESDRVSAVEEAPYEPPTVVELLFGTDEDAPDPEVVLDPVAESQRLQREGLVAPNDPAARPVEDLAPPPPVSPYPSGVGMGTGRQRLDPFDALPERATEAPAAE